MRNILERIKSERLYFDGGTGTVLQKSGLMPGESPEILNRRAPEVIRKLHLDYIAAGADIIKTNTFGINALKSESVEDELAIALGIARDAVTLSGKEVYVAFDVGPTGRMLKPFGDLDFEDAVEIFARNMRCAEALGADLILVETMSDIYELKAAVLAARENSSLPVFVTCAFGADGKLLTGADPLAVIAMLEGLGVSALGMNCSVGPDKMKSTLEAFVKYSSLPIIVNPNAGLPTVKDGESVYDLDADGFAASVAELCDMGATVLGGCCGTTPEYIARLVEATKNKPYFLPQEKDITVASSYTHGVIIGESSRIVGERLNPTGKPKLREALKNNDISSVLSIALEQEMAGAHILDVNAGVAGIDEASVLSKMVSEIQSVTDLPLQIDTGSPEAMERALRIYSGKPLINSVNGSKESLGKILPLAKKYGGALIALTMDERGIPEDADGRVEIAERIAKAAAEYGIRSCDLIFDPLVLTVASGADNANVTLEAMRRIKEMGYKCSLGVSNVSFGLPDRDRLNASFYTAALFMGLDLAIINPSSESMMSAYRSYMAISGKDSACSDYVSYVAKLSADNENAESVNVKSADISLSAAIERGLKADSAAIAERLLGSLEPLEVINNEIIPALNKVGSDFEKGIIYLPGLLMSAEAANAAFSVIRERADVTSESSGKIILATVKGDIHDIGKNIVKLIFESHGYSVIDLGRDVSKEDILDTVKKNPDAILGLSALMTTTLSAMEDSVALVKRECPKTKIMVGGAVLTESYSKSIGADFYAPDALSAVKYANEIK